MESQAVSGTKKPLFGGRKPLFTQKELLLLTGPLLVEQLLEVTVGMADTMMVSRCGEAAISGVSLVDMINNLIIVLFAALATGGAVVVSQFLGAREQKDADASSGQLLLLSGVFGLLVGAFCFVFARPMIRLFYGAIDADVLDASVLYLRIIAISYPFLALYNGGAALFRSMGNSKISMQISVLMNIINIVGNAVCIFGLKMGVDGVAWPSVVSRVIAAVLILGRCYQKGHALTVPRTVKLDTGMAKRILGMGDVVSLIENAVRVQQAEEEELEAERMMRGQLTLDDFLMMNKQVRKMGGVSKLISALPGGDKALGSGQVDEGALDAMEVIINSMTKAERAKPELLNGSRRARIAKGAGVTVTDVNQMMKKFNETKKMVKQATAGMEQQASRKGKKGKKGKRRRGLGIPGMGGMSMSDLKKIQDMMGQ